MHEDLVGPLPALPEGHVYLLTCIDMSTRWVEVLPLKNIEAAMWKDAFKAGWVSCFGMPATVTTDRGTQFTSSTWKRMCDQVNIQHALTTSFHHQSNGMVERVHRQIKDALCAQEGGSAWLQHLPWVLLRLRATPKEDSNSSSAEQVMGTRLLLPGQMQCVGDM